MLGFYPLGLCHQTYRIPTFASMDSPVNGNGGLHLFTQGELQGQASLVLMSNLFLRQPSSHPKITLMCDNKGIQHSCSAPVGHSLQHHHEPNMDLYLQMRDSARDLKILHDWLRSHQDKVPWSTIYDLQKQSLSRDEIFYVWCDKKSRKNLFLWSHKFIRPWSTTC
jgi:hypothetical protein